MPHFESIGCFLASEANGSLHGGWNVAAANGAERINASAKMLVLMSPSDHLEHHRQDHEQLNGVEHAMRDDAGDEVLGPVKSEADDQRDDEDADQQQRLAQAGVGDGEEDGRYEEADALLQPAAEERLLDRHG